MNALERITQIINKIQKEREELEVEISEYLVTDEAQRVKAQREKDLKQYLVISEYIEKEITAPKAEKSEKLSPQEKAQAVQLLNKRLSQVNNTQEKTKIISNLVIEYIQQNIPNTKLDAFTVILLKRMIEQIKAQVSTNKESAVGYAYLLMWLSQSIPNLISKYKYTMFTSALPLDCLLGMYRVYFTVLKESNNPGDAWTFISSLLNYTEEISSTFNPCVISVFLDVLLLFMRNIYTKSWFKIEDYIKNIYLPLVDSKKYATEILQIKSYLT
ncbi:hypothetical protein NEIG_00609 [Nematocida sp. ERTm5]|nr:hypothetical protein NEIRO02_1354 [Nematocida sp. AWRm79]KAI5183680.1 hypothetical protein NEIRO03_1259 [Nematocida sp. AWRm78]OAG31012.1 hypothetical protein NEIG_00609 [Nematocida sp. ERTm5]